MARARNIKPSFFTNDILGECDPLARLLFAGLWTIADREGRLEDRPKKIKAELLPYDNCDGDALLQQLADRQFIVRYESGGLRYMQIANFTKHQSPHLKEGASTIPAPDKSGANTILTSEPSNTLINNESRQAPDKHQTSLIQNVPLPPSLNPLPDSPIPHPSSTTISENRIDDVPKPYHAVDFHPRFNEVREYITKRLPALNRQNATEVNRWLMEGADPEADIFPSVDNAIDFKRGDIGSFSYFTKTINTMIHLKKERLEQHERMRNKYAESN